MSLLVNGIDWQYGLWNFKFGDPKFNILLHKNKVCILKNSLIPFEMDDFEPKTIWAHFYEINFFQT